MLQTYLNKIAAQVFEMFDPLDDLLYLPMCKSTFYSLKIGPKKLP